MLEFIRMINNDFASVLSLLSSIIMVIVTIIYVGHTRRQANYAKESVELVAKQFKTEKQPCIVPALVDSYGCAFGTTNYSRIQLGFDINLKNSGDAPAINIYAIAEIELQFTNDSDGNKSLLSAALLPNYVQAISSGEEKRVNIHFETREVNLLIKDLTKAHELNIERIRTDPSQNHYYGARLIVHVYYKNIMGQWWESTISYEISWLRYKNPPRNKTHNLNEITIPPKQIHKGDEFKATYVSDGLAPFKCKMTNDEQVRTVLKKYLDESPWLVEFFDNN